MATATGKWRRAARRAGWSNADMRYARRAGYGPQDGDAPRVPTFLQHPQDLTVSPNGWRPRPGPAPVGGIRPTDIHAFSGSVGGPFGWRENGTTVGLVSAIPGAAVGATGSGVGTIYGAQGPGYLTSIPNPADPNRVTDPAISGYLQGNLLPRPDGTLPGPTEQEAPWYVRLFDYTDTWGEDGHAGEQWDAGPVESLWDGFLGVVSWGTNTVSAATVAAMSASPDRQRTLTWDEAQNVSFGQMLDTIASDPSGFLGKLPGAGPGVQASAYARTAMAVQGAGPLNWHPGFDITSEEQRRAAFEDDARGKWGTGVVDAAFSWWADPTVIFGKALKVGRVLTVDRAVTSANDVIRVRDELARGAVSAATGDPAVIGKAAPVAQFARWVTAGDKDGVVPTLAQIYNHKVIRTASNRDALANALHAAETYDEAALIIRAAYRDPEAITELMVTRADIADGLARDARTQFVNRMLANPDIISAERNRAGVRLNEARKRLTAAYADRGTTQGAKEYRAAQAQHRKLSRELDAINNFEVRDPVAHPFTPDEQAAADALVAQMLMRNPKLNQAYELAQSQARSEYALSRAALADDVTGVLNGTGTGFGRGAIGRLAEARRESIAVARDATGQMGRWKFREFGSTDGFKRLARVHYWVGNESASGYVGIRNGAEHESLREIRAVLDSLDTYTTTDAGRAARDDLLNMWAAARTPDERMAAFAELTDRIAKDMAAHHGVDEDLVASAMEAGQKELAALTKSIREKARFVDDADQSVNFVPYLQARLTDGTYMLNYRAAERELKYLATDPGFMRGVRKSKVMAVNTAERFYRSLNALWRPAVLLRLAYPLRNVGEGVAREVAYTNSIMPLLNVARQVGHGVGNGLRKRATLRGVKSVERGRGSARFDRWRDTQRIGHDAQLQSIDEQVAAMEEQLDTLILQGDLYPGVARNEAAARAQANLRGEVDDTAAAGASLIADRSGALTFAREARDQLSAAVKGYNNGTVTAEEVEAAYQAFYRNLTDLPVQSRVAASVMAQRLVDLSLYRESLAFNRSMLDDDAAALARYRDWGTAKRRVYDRSEALPDGRTVANAFSDPEQTPAALWNLSADGTTHGLLSGSAQEDKVWIDAVAKKTAVNVTWSLDPKKQKDYWNGMALALNSIRDSPLGGRLIAELRSPVAQNRQYAAQRVARWLMSDGEGSVVAGHIGVKDMDQAVAYVDDARERLLAWTNDGRFLDAVKDRNLTPDEVKAMWGPVDHAEMPDVIGNPAVEMGARDFFRLIDQSANKMFKVLGTMPEDFFVRSPFYGQRFQEYRDMAIQLQQQLAGPTTLNDLNRIQKEAHRRALKETKDWLFTIDRRTNLARVAEYVLPFTSAYQNSLTTLGRLAWRDPSLPARIALIWQSPQDAGIEDEKGNLLFPVPWRLLPPGPIRDMLPSGDMVIPKDALASAIIPMQLPQFGPVQQIAGSELMKAGILSAGTPGILKGLPGNVGDGIYAAFKGLLFGEEGSVSSVTGSVDKALSSWMKTAIAMWNGEEHSTAYGSYYTRISQTEMLRWMAGERDTLPTQEELQARTDGLYWIRLLGNLGPIPTPPQYTMPAQPLVDEYARYQRMYGFEADEKFSSVYGDQVLMAMNRDATKSTTGFGVSSASADEMTKLTEVIRGIAPNMPEADLAVLGILSDVGMTGDYDPSTRAIQLSGTIPGTTIDQRKILTPAQQAYEAGRQTGWNQYDMLMKRIDSLLQERGLTDVYQTGAEDIRAEYDAGVQALKSNELLKGWVDDFGSPGSTRTQSTLYVMESALGSEEFMRDHADDPKWQGAAEYLKARDALQGMLSQRVQQSGGEAPATLTAVANKDLARMWQETQVAIARRYPGFDSIYNRFLRNDTKISGR